MRDGLPKHIIAAIDAAPHVFRETHALREIAISPRTQRQLDLAEKLTPQSGRQYGFEELTDDPRRNAEYLAFDIQFLLSKYEKRHLPDPVRIAIYKCLGRIARQTSDDWH